MKIPEAVQAAAFKIEAVHQIHGHQCLCGFESAVSRDRTRHIVEATLAEAAPTIATEAIRAAAANADITLQDTPAEVAQALREYAQDLEEGIQ